MNDSTANFLRGHAAAFEAWDAVPRQILHDNLKSAVIDRVGDAVHFNPDMLALAGHYRFSSKAVPPATPNEKGRVERAIRCIRCNFFLGISFKDIEDLNSQAAEWCEQESLLRKNRQNKLLTVKETFVEEQPLMLICNPYAFPAYDRVLVTAGKTPFVRFDHNDYSVPANFARRQLLVEASLDTVTISNGLQTVARHPRSFDKGLQIENPEHISANF